MQVEHSKHQLCLHLIQKQHTIMHDSTSYKNLMPEHCLPAAEVHSLPSLHTDSAALRQGSICGLIHSAVAMPCLAGTLRRTHEHFG